MAVIINLDDGGQFYQSTGSVDGALKLIAAEIDVEHLPLKRWLLDVSDRVPPFMDFDTRGFHPTDRAVFWHAVEQAHCSLVAKFGPDYHQRTNAFAASCLHYLHLEKVRIDAGQPPHEPPVEFHPMNEIDLGDVWSNPSIQDEEAS